MNFRYTSICICFLYIPELVYSSTHEPACSCITRHIPVGSSTHASRSVSWCQCSNNHKGSGLCIANGYYYYCTYFGERTFIIKHENMHIPLLKYSSPWVFCPLCPSPPSCQQSDLINLIFEK